jgi:hypothetical protein
MEVSDDDMMVQCTVCGGFSVYHGIDVFDCCYSKGGFKGLMMMV